MPRLLLGIDCGLTVTKAALFDAEGVQHGSASAPIGHQAPQPRMLERDMESVWRQCAAVTRAAIQSAGVAASEVAAVGLTGHGDGLYLVDQALAPVRPAILSMDSRAVDLLAERSAAGSLGPALPLTGQLPFPGSTAALLAWIAVHEPRSLDRTRHVLGCKDWIKLRLTGVASTDPTDASCAFTDVRTQRYSRDVLAMYGIEGLWERLAPVVPSYEVAGTVTREAAEMTGLVPGTPVVSGLHDVDACVIGTGAYNAGQLSIIAGSFSINQTVAASPIVDERWLCRNFVQPGRWLHLSVSPASASNLEWFASELCMGVESAPPERDRLFEAIERGVREAMGRPRELWYLPFLYGSPLDNHASAAFVGLRGWHSRSDLARALFEGVVFNHMWHVRALSSAFSFTEARLTGGGSRSQTWSQMFADGIGLPVALTAAEETGVLGAAMCAGISCGLFASVDDAVQAVVRIKRVYEPRQQAQAAMAEAYEVYRSVAAALRPLWGRSEVEVEPHRTI